MSKRNDRLMSVSARTQVALIREAKANDRPLREHATPLTVIGKLDDVLTDMNFTATQEFRMTAIERVLEAVTP